MVVPLFHSTIAGEPERVPFAVGTVIAHPHFGMLADGRGAAFLYIGIHQRCCCGGRGALRGISAFRNRQYACYAVMIAAYTGSAVVFRTSGTDHADRIAHIHPSVFYPMSFVWQIAYVDD